MAALAAAIDALHTGDPEQLSDPVLAEEYLALQQQADRLHGACLQRLAVLDARGAAGAEQDLQIGSTAAWLRRRLRMSAKAAASSVRTARTLFRGPLSRTAQALCAGQISAAHAAVVAAGTHDLPNHVAAEAEPAFVNAARRLDPTRLRRVVDHLRLVADPDGADAAAQRRYERRGLWLSATWDQMVAVNGLLEPEAGHTLLAALEPLARPADAQDARSGSQRTADALTELARCSLEAGQLPRAGGVRPQLLVTVDLDSLLGCHGALGGEAGWAGPLEAEACRRLACDATLTRVLVSRKHPDGRQPAGCEHDGNGEAGPPVLDPSGEGEGEGLAERLQAALALLPPILGGTPSQPLEVGRASRVITPAQRNALAVRDGGCVFPDCDRPLAWCDGHHLIHWLDGGPTDLHNLAMLCRGHHRAVHEGGWQLGRDPDGRFRASPPHRRHRSVA